jgi:hypothetical protein
MGAGWKHGPAKGAGVGGPAKGAGKGLGWGGPAKGASTSRIRPGDPDRIQPMSNTPEVKPAGAVLREYIRPHLQALIEKQLQLAQGADQLALAASQALLNRIDPPQTKQDVTSDGKAVQYVIAAPPEDEDADAWQARQQGNA